MVLPFMVQDDPGHSLAVVGFQCFPARGSLPLAHEAQPVTSVLVELTGEPEDGEKGKPESGFHAGAFGQKQRRRCGDGSRSRGGSSH